MHQLRGNIKPLDHYLCVIEHIKCKYMPYKYSMLLSISWGKFSLGISPSSCWKLCLYFLNHKSFLSHNEDRLLLTCRRECSRLCEPPGALVTCGIDQSLHRQTSQSGWQGWSGSSLQTFFLRSVIKFNTPHNGASIFSSATLPFWLPWPPSSDRNSEAVTVKERCDSEPFRILELLKKTHCSNCRMLAYVCF